MASNTTKFCGKHIKEFGYSEPNWQLIFLFRRKLKSKSQIWFGFIGRLQFNTRMRQFPFRHSELLYRLQTMLNLYTMYQISRSIPSFCERFILNRSFKNQVSKLFFAYSWKYLGWLMTVVIKKRINFHFLDALESRKCW